MIKEDKQQYPSAGDSHLSTDSLMLVREMCAIPFLNTGRQRLDLAPQKSLKLYAALENNPARHPLWRTAERFHAVTHKPLGTERAMNEHRARAINAICVCIADRVNVVEGKVYMTLAQISDACGLTTWSNGVPSYPPMSG